VTAKRNTQDEDAVALEVTGSGLRLLDREAYRRFAQVGIDQLDRGHRVHEEEADRRIAAIMAKHDPQ